MVRPQAVVSLLPLCSQIDVGAAVNSHLGEPFSRKNNTHGSWLHDRDPQFASRILGAMTQSCYIGTCDIRSRVIRGPYCMYVYIYIYIYIYICAPSHPCQATASHFEGLAQERRYSSGSAMEWCRSCTNPLIWWLGISRWNLADLIFSELQ